MKIGISYSWDDDAHKRWVRQLTERLTDEGFEVIYDEKVGLGSRLPHFMEQMVSQSDRVLVICTATYKQSFDSRHGGVGYEGHLISAAIVKDYETARFIPVLRRDSWKNALPVCLEGTLGIDLSSGDFSGPQWEKLLEDLRNSTSDISVAVGHTENSRRTTGLISGRTEIEDALSHVASQGVAYYRVIRMSPHPSGFEKTNMDLLRAAKQSIIWHDENPWPISIGLLEFMLKENEDEEPHDPYTKKEFHANGITYSMRMDHLQRYEYLEIRRDCSLTIVETEDFHWYRRGQIMFDKAIGTVSDALSFWTRFYKNLGFAGNTVALQIGWNGLKGLRLTALNEPFVERARTLAISPRVCHESSVVESERLTATPANAVGWHFDHVRRLSGYLLGQFGFDPSEELIRAVLADNESTLSGPPQKM